MLLKQCNWNECCFCLVPIGPLASILLPMMDAALFRAAFKALSAAGAELLIPTGEPRMLWDMTGVFDLACRALLA